ncbi:MAG: ribosome silencing factor [candidate division WOR-3 bacterium]|nr:ribosome silencing factor [candidate division WOR-3 bacterium]MCX7948327.1 ribosome silencing factor [candidate division WOR-3 bacterium]MDW8150845.1 ribosome silencing factor [candidate division WOR-3 bacterium]
MLLDRIVELIVEKKGFDVVIIELKNISTIADYFIVASGYTNDHLVAIAEHIEKEFEPYREEGRGSKWISLDYVDIIVHLLTKEAREFYDLEGFWIKAPQKKIVQTFEV